MPVVIKVILGLVSVIFFGFVGLGLFMTSGTIPDSQAVTGEELPKKAIEALRREGIVFPEEKIYYYYSEDLFSYADYGNLFTDQRIISYELDENSERAVYWAEYAEVSDIEYFKSESLLEDSVIDIYIDDEYNFSLLVSAEADRDQEFYDKLLDVWRANAPMIETETASKSDPQGVNSPVRAGAN